MTDSERERLVAILIARWPNPNPPDSATISVFLAEYKKVREYLSDRFKDTKNGF